ncbi:MAG: hypothetical protein AAGD01_13390 [Acidobacteriota bacterium]
MLAAFVLSEGLIATHNHDEHTGGECSSVALSDRQDHDLPDTTEHVASSTSIDAELCLVCAVARRLGALDATQPTSPSPMVVPQAIHPADDLVVSGFDALHPAPRGPPTL